jgi:hypothetical protein
MDAPIASLDPKNVNGRLYDCISSLLDSFQDMTVSEQVRTVSAIARIQVLFAKIREEPGAYNASNSGQTVRKYAKAFEAHATRRGKTIAGSAATAALLDATADDDELEY